MAYLILLSLFFLSDLLTCFQRLVFFFVFCFFVFFPLFLSYFCLEPQWSPVGFVYHPNGDYPDPKTYKSIPKECKILSTEFTGPEDFAFDKNDFAYTGLLNGTILRFDTKKENPTFESVVNTGGRPLGMRFAPDGTLWIADASKGLLSFKNGKLTTELTEVDGLPFKLADHLAITKDGSHIYFSDASYQYDLDHLDGEMWEGRPYGRLIKYKPASKKASVVCDDNLYFPNGVVLSEDENTLIFSETFAGRISKVSVHGAKKGKKEVIRGVHFADNLTPHDDKTFWVAMVGKREPILDTIAASPFLRRLMRKLPLPLKPWAMGVLMDKKGNILKVYADESGELLTKATTYNPHKGYLYVGSYIEKFIARCKL